MSEDTARTMLDRYELLAPIARGGMGSVHLARLAGAGGFQRLYAIKRMHPHLADEAEFVAMLLDEARLAARLHHTNAVAIIDVREHAEGPFVVMDYVDGVTLGRLATGAEALPWRERTRLLLRVICDALAGLHAAHDLADDDGAHLALVHRDVSPQNVLVGTDGVGRITDFGIAVAAARITASRPGSLKGKPAYMSPEQVSGETVDRRSDLFAMGVVLWECLTGERLFHSGSEAGALMMVLTATIDPPRARVAELPEALSAVCVKALSRDRAGRYADAREMLVALEAAASQADLLASNHEVADAIKGLFRDELTARKNLLRDAARARGLASLSGFTSTQEVADTMMRGDSKSIPAIEVISRPHDPPAPIAAPAAQGSEVYRRGIVPVALGAAALALGGMWALRSSHPSERTPSAAHAPATPPPLHSPAVIPESALPPAPAPAPAPAASDAAVTAMAEDVPAPAHIESPSRATASAHTAPPRAPDRSPRPLRAPAAPGAPAPPTLEVNPYLR